MNTSTKSKIISYIKTHGQARPHDLSLTLQISNVAVHKQLKNLLTKGLISRVGKPPHVFYTIPLQLNEPIKAYGERILPENVSSIVEDNFLSITPDGKLLYGLEGFSYWTNLYQKNKPFEQIAQDYFITLSEQRKYFTDGGWIDATSKIRETFKNTCVSALLFQDIYSYKTFGRTRLARLVMYAKQTGAKELIDKISIVAKPVIERIIKDYSIEAVVFIPPTVPRPLQFMDEFALKLRLLTPEIKLVKVVPGDLPIPQKTLSSLEERVINARESIFIENVPGSTYANVLLIDDVVGSGASFNETAKKLKALNIGYKNIVAFALVGNIKGYDVIREI